MWCLHLICYCLLLLCNLLPNPESEMKTGWAVIGIVGIIFLFNASLMMYNTMKSLKLQWRNRRIKQMQAQKLKVATQRIVLQKQQEAIDRENFFTQAFV